MRNLRLPVLLLAIVSLVSFASAQKKQLDTFGYYTIKNPAKEFADISYIGLHGDYGAEQNPPTYGFVTMTSERRKPFRLFKPVLNGTSISFKSVSIGGISYSFTGKFTRFFVRNQNNYEKLNGGGIALSGTLTKLRNGRAIAAQSVAMTYFPGT